MREPVLAEKTYSERGIDYRIKVVGGLHMIGGNGKPYFTITANVDRWSGKNWVEDSGGCCHDLIRKLFGNRFDDLIALHLSDINGVPMHAVENGWYYLAGAVPGNFGQRYHMGNSKGHYNGEYREPTPGECLEVLARHLRLSVDEVRSLTEIRIEKVDDEIHVGMTVEEIKELEKRAKQEAKDKFVAFVEKQKERFESEAKACIEKHDLKVFGDQWPIKEKSA